MPDRSERLLPLALLVGVLLLFLPPGGLHDWWYPDEPDVALPAIEMQARGDWVVPTHNGVAWLDYPPLAYWGARVVGTVHGTITPFVTRVPMALFALLLIAATMWVGRQLGHPQRGLLAGVFLVATPTLWFHATNLQVDLGYAAAITLGLALYHASESLVGARAWWLRVVAFASFGVAILGKGPLGVLLPGLILTCWHLWNREWMRVLLLAPLALVSLAVALPWYVFLCNRLGVDLVYHEIMAQNFERFSEAKRAHGGKGLFYYFTRVPADLGVWTALIIPALWSGFRQRRQDRSWRLLAVWFIAPFLFFTFASTKRNVYLLPVFPALAVLIADWLIHSAAAWERGWQRWSARIIAGILIVIGLGLFGAGIAWSALPVPSALPLESWNMMRPGAVVIGLWLLVTGGWSLWVAGEESTRRWWGIAASMTVSYALALWLVFPAIDTVRTYEPAAHWLAQRVPLEQRVGFHLPGRENTKRPAWLCYLGGRRLEFLSTPAEAMAWLAADHTRLLLTSPSLAETLTDTQVVQTWHISSDEWAVVSAK